MVSNCTGSARCLAAGLVLAAANLYYSVLRALSTALFVMVAVMHGVI